MTKQHPAIKNVTFEPTGQTAMDLRRIRIAELAGEMAHRTGDLPQAIATFTAMSDADLLAEWICFKEACGTV